jgi:hypothetical protein
MTSEYKVATMKRYAAKFGISVLVETGTCFGDAIAEVRDSFQTIYSIELSPELHSQAEARFAGDHGVHLLLGDSGVVLFTLLPQLPTRCLFWLDAHYSGGVTARGPVDTPIVKELEAIFSLRPEGVVLIDDAQCFDGTNSYPKLEDLERYVRFLNFSFDVEGDIIRICHDPS